MRAPRGLPRGRLAARLVAVWAAATLALLLLSAVLPGVRVDGLGGAAAASALIGVLNAVLYPALIWATASIAALTFGILTLALNAGLVLLADAISPAFDVAGFWPALWLVLGTALVNAVVTALLAIDDEGSFYRGVVLRQARRARRREGLPAAEREPGTLFLEIDGLSERVLRQALRRGHMPTLAGWVESGTHRITGWECDLSSQTSASQAGLLHGSNEGIPAFRWYDRELGRPVVSAKPADAAIIEQRASDGHGLLAGGGASRGNLVTGDAPSRTLTISALTGPLADHHGRRTAWQAFLSNPYAMPRTLLLFAHDVLTELRSARRQRRADVRPRVHRGGRYPMLRAATTAFLPEATASMVIGDVLRGVPCAYATFVGYDEVAHHSGVRAHDALAVLRRVDRTFGRIAAAARLAPRRYRIVVLSDHGQSQGATFLQRHGEALEELVRGLTDGRVRASGGTDDEAQAQLDVALGEAGEAGAHGTGWLARRLRRDGAAQERDPQTDGRAEQDVLVFASGNLGLLYFPDSPQRATVEEIRERHPRLVDGLAAHEGIGLVAGISAAGEPVVATGHADHALEAPEVTALLAPYGPRTAAHLRRELGFANAPDLLLISRYDPEAGEVAAFEELVGSHGGLGGPQSHPFLLHPVDLPVPATELVGAGAVHAVLRSWVLRHAPQTERAPA